LGLVVECDCVFKELDNGDIAGLEQTPTTKAAGERWQPRGSSNTGGLVHVFVSMKREWLDEALGAGWYPVAVNRRVVAKPVVDHLRFGLALGYPECCARPITTGRGSTQSRMPPLPRAPSNGRRIASSSRALSGSSSICRAVSTVR
jgi:hypothetical protein